jgi:large subunit ribosomal protein L13e
LREAGEEVVGVSGEEIMTKPPVPIVKKPHLVKLGPIDTGVRKGRGFSLGEITKAGLTLSQARKLGIYVDKRRKTVHEWNVKVLKEYLDKLSALGKI